MHIYVNIYLIIIIYTYTYPSRCINIDTYKDINPLRYHDPLTQNHVNDLNTVNDPLTVFTLFT
jgi:hypothetical protein